jgi:serine phosphatase RsbU (regulator of sigma subunit)
MEGLKFRGGDIELQKGDVLYVYTDGVTEATNAENDLFGIDRMLDALNKDVSASVEAIDTNVRSAIDAFVEEAHQFDDITMLTFRYNGAE